VYPLRRRLRGGARDFSALWIGGSSTFQDPAVENGSRPGSTGAPSYGGRQCGWWFRRAEAQPIAVAEQQTAPVATAAERSEFDRWWETQARVSLPVSADGAKVLVVKFNDYQCPACGQTYFAYERVLAKYEANHPGAVRFVALDYPLDPECNTEAPNGAHTAACEAAVAVRLAREVGQAPRMERWLFTNQASLTPERIRTALQEIAGVRDFDRRYSNVLNQVKADIALGASLGVDGTPTFVINGVQVKGGLSPQFFDAAIAHELKRADGS
jgi:protein-disulfide isomerase